MNFMHRISARGILINTESKILLALERAAPDTDGFWIPPGGGLEEEDADAVACVRREFLEETGLAVEVGPLLYVREFSEPSRHTHHVGLYFLVHDYRGDVYETEISKAPQGADLRRHVQWFTQEQLQGVLVYPKELHDDFWRDRAPGVTETKYLAAAHEEEQNQPGGPSRGRRARAQARRRNYGT